MKKKIDIASVCFLGDMNLIFLQIKSILKFLTKEDIAKYIIIINDNPENSELIKRNIKDKLKNTWLEDLCVVKIAHEIEPSSYLLRGWVSQQVLKLNSYRFALSDYILILDSKNHFVKKFNFYDFFFVDNSNILLQKVKLRIIKGNQLLWLISSLQFFDVPLISANFLIPPTTTPYLFNKKLLTEMIEKILSKNFTTLVDFFLENQLCTEFFLYTSFLLKKNILYDHFFHTKKVLSSTLFGKFLNIDIESVINNKNISIFGLHRAHDFNKLDVKLKNYIFNLYLEHNLFENKSEIQNYFK